MIWDLHTHLTRSLHGQTPAEKAAHLIEVGSRHGIEKFCCYMGVQWTQDPDPEDLTRQNDEILEAVEAHPDQLLGFVYVNPLQLEASIDEIHRCVRDGPMVAVKLWVAKRCSDREIDPIVETAAKLGVAVFQHTWIKSTGNLPGESSPEDLARLATRFPETSFVCGHAGGNWEIGIPSVRDHPNISLGLGGFDPTAGVTEMAVRELGAERVLFGSDAPGRSFASQLAKVTGAQISEADKSLILGKNLQKLLNPAMKARGLSS